MWGNARFGARLTFKMGRTGREGKPASYPKYFRTLIKFFGIFYVGVWITQKMVCYSTRKSSKWGVCVLRGLFDLQNGLDWMYGPTGCIDEVLMDVH